MEQKFKKRARRLSAAILAIMTVLPSAAFEYQGLYLEQAKIAGSDGVIREYKGWCITGYNKEYFGDSDSWDIVIPKTIRGDIEILGEMSTEDMPVLAIADKAFYSCKELSSFLFEDVTNHLLRIGDKAFSNCENLTTVAIPFAYDNQGDPFRECRQLKKVFTGNPYNFNTDPGIVSVPENSDVADLTIEDGAYLYFSKDKSAIWFASANVKDGYTLPASVTTIGDGVFARCSGLTDFHIPNTVTSVGSKAFYCCDNLAGFTVEDGVEALSFGSKALYLTPIQNLYLGRDWTTTSSDMDGNGNIVAETLSTGIKEVKLGNMVTRLPEAAFKGCADITDVILPEKLSEIDTYAFDGCNKLFSIILLAPEVSVASSAFINCPEIKKVAARDTRLFAEGGEFSKILVQWAIEENETVDPAGIIWAADNENEPFVMPSYRGELVIPDQVTTLDYACMAMCPNVTRVILPRTLTTIGTQAFYGCTGLTDITIPGAVTTIYQQAFYGCTGLVKGAYPDTLEENPLPENCTALRFDAFDSKTDNGFVYSRDGAKLYYAPLHVAEDFAVPESVKEITANAFELCASLKSVQLPAQLEKLGDNIWKGCPNIEQVTYTSSTPVEAASNIFNSAVYDKAVLYVPEGTAGKFASVVPWKYFISIKEDSGENPDTPDTGIDDIEASADIEVYNISGLPAGKSFENLPAGIYIVRQGSKTTKIAVK